MNTYAEHVRWCKQRANEYLEMGDTHGAFSSMVSDMNKHPETAGVIADVAIVGMAELRAGSIDGLRQWVNGFAE